MELKKYLKDNGLIHAWFAKKIGLGPNALCEYLRGRRSLSSKFWTKIIVETKGEVSYEELVKANDERQEKQNATKETHENVRPQKQCVCSAKG